MFIWGQLRFSDLMSEFCLHGGFHESWKRDYSNFLTFWLFEKTFFKNDNKASCQSQPQKVLNISNPFPSNFRRFFLIFFIKFYDLWKFNWEINKLATKYFFWLWPPIIPINCYNQPFGNRSLVFFRKRRLIFKRVVDKLQIVKFWAAMVAFPIV